jgi:hypothetical protein
MTNSTKTLIGTIAGLAALVAIFAIMSDCSKHVSDTGAANCVATGGTWNPDLGTEGICQRPSK